MKFLALLLALHSSFVYADKKIDAKKMSLLGKIDEESLNKVEPSKPTTDVPAANSKFSLTCKDATGKEFKQGELGYDTCLLGLKNQHDLKRLNSDMNKKNNSNDGSSVNFNYKIGD